jgi:hypothetical protein
VTLEVLFVSGNVKSNEHGSLFQQHPLQMIMGLQMVQGGRRLIVVGEYQLRRRQTMRGPIGEVLDT